MRTAGNKAFTLIELIIVIMIIAILATLIVPTVRRAIALAQQAKCNTNIRTIITGLTQYDNACEVMPKVPVTTWNVAIGSGLNSNPFNAASARNHSANMWLLAREDCVDLGAFVCPGTTDIKSEYQELRKYWDFGSSRYISYGLQSPYGYGGSLSRITPEGVVLAADGSPYVQTSEEKDPGKLRTGTIRPVPWSSDAMSGDDKQLYGNSPNHEHEGQNVGYIDGSAGWRTAANCGKDGDNIYSASNHKTATSAEGVLNGNSMNKNNPNDTLILP